MTTSTVAVIGLLVLAWALIAGAVDSRAQRLPQVERRAFWKRASVTWTG